MNILEVKPEYVAQGNWTEPLETRYNKALIKEKKQLFKEMEIPFPSEIETKFWDAVSKGNKNAEIYLENLCHSHIKYALDNYAKVLYDKLISEYDGETIYERELQNLVGKYGIKELTRSGLIQCCGSYRGNKLYAL